MNTIREMTIAEQRLLSATKDGNKRLIRSSLMNLEDLYKKLMKSDKADIAKMGREIQNKGGNKVFIV